MCIGQTVSVPYGEFKQLISDSQQLADIKSLYKKDRYPNDEVRIILGIEEKKDGND